MSDIINTPLYGVAMTVIVYVVSLQLYKKFRWLHPLFLTSLTLIGFILWSDTYEEYQIGGQVITFFLGPATVALGVPIYKQFSKIKSHFLPLISGIVAGSITGIGSAGLFVYWLGGSEEVMLSMLPKSATSPIAIELAVQLGGSAELGAVFTVLTGLLGSMVGPEVLRWFGIGKGLAIGVAVGTASHGIGTARLVRESEYLGSISAVSMGLAGMVTSFAVVPLHWWLG